MKIIMLGAPGAGKGTQAKQIAAKYQIPHISTGDIFRANIKNGTELGKKAKTYMDQGALVPDELTCDLVMDRIQQDDCKNGFILDGFPRTVPQAKALEDMKIEMDLVISIEVSDESIIKRMGGRRLCSECGASYHTEHIPPKKEVISRLEVYHKQTEPLKEFYSERGKLVLVNGSDTIENITAEIEKKLESIRG